MADYLTSPPAEKLIPVTLGCDRSFTIQRVGTDGSPVNFGTATVAIWIDIDRNNPTQVQATVSGSTAAFVIPNAVCDLVKTGTRWRIVLAQGTLETPLLVGKFERHDGS